MPVSPSVQFCAAVRVLNAAARAEGLRPPTFRSPPTVAGAVRTVRRWPDGRATVAVARRERPWPAVLADCVEGVVVANRLTGAAAVRARTALWAALSAELGTAA